MLRIPVIIALATTVALPVAPAQAAEPGPMCTGYDVLEVSPGLSTEPTTGTVNHVGPQENVNRPASKTTVPSARTVWNAAPSSRFQARTSNSSPGRTGEAKRPEIPPNRSGSSPQSDLRSARPVTP